MPGRQMKEFPASNHVLSSEFSRVRDADPQQRVEISVYFKPRTELDAAALPHEAVARKSAVHARRVTEHEGDVLFLREFAELHGLTVTSVETERRLVKLSGTVTQIQAAFQVNLGVYTDGKRESRRYQGTLHLPDNLVESVESVLGLDDHPIAQPRLVPAIAAPHAQNAAYWPNQVGALYNFPTDANGSGQCIALIELAGGYYPNDITSAFSQMSLPVPTVVAVSVDGAINNPDDGSGANPEVALDIQVAGGNAPGARIAVYFAPNTTQGFADAITQAANDTANNPSVISISWGAAEVDWAAEGSQAMQTMNTAFQDAATMLVSCFAASGDQLATDGVNNGKANVDFPASSPWAIGCGGTTITTDGSTITSEVVWNSGTNGTGGGISDYFPEPAFQLPVPIPPSYNDGQVRRGVPDVAGDADPASGYNVVVNGSTLVYGGTSAVAPLWSGLTALVNQAAAQRVGFYMPQLYANRQPFREILQGNNIYSGIGYNAGPIWNACSGLGVPNGAAVVTMLARPAQSGTKIGGVQWTQQPQLRIYYQGVGNEILENRWTGSTWTPGATLPVAAVPESALAAVCWTDVQIRVYYQDANNVIQEYCWTGNSWAQGTTLPTAAAGSALAAVCWANVQIRVYYQDANNVIQEYRWTGNGWSTGAPLPTAAAGSALAAVTWGDAQLRVYYQDASNAIQEYCWTGNGWTQGATLPTALPGTALTAVAWGNVEIRLYYQDADNVVQEYCWTGSQWTKGATLPPAIPNTPLDSLAWTDSSGQQQLRVYYEANGAINEAAFGASGWETGAGYISVAAGTAPHMKTAAATPAKSIPVAV